MTKKTENNTERSTIVNADNVPLNPAHPDECAGNGEHGIECQCDECDYLMLCADAFKKEGDEP